MNRKGWNSQFHVAIGASAPLSRGHHRPTSIRAVVGHRALLARRRRGSAYVMVLGCSMSVAIIGVTGITALRVERSQATRSGDFAQARMAAQSAIEIGFREMNQNASWRTTYTSGTWFSDRKMGTAQCSLSGQDPGDNDLADSNTDNVILTGVGVAGAAAFTLSVALTANTPALDLLKSAVHAGQIEVKSGNTLTASGAPVSTNGDIQLASSGLIYGDVQAASASRPQNLYGTVTIPATSMPMPDPGVLDLYASKATSVAFASTIRNAYLGPGVNSLGAPNANGIYYIDSRSGNLTLEAIRVRGTLVVRGAGRTLTLKPAAFLEAISPNQPVLVTDANVSIELESGTTRLDEAAIGVNLNPLGLDFNGVVDIDLVDTYPNEIRGLVHTQGELKLKQTSKVKGILIVEGLFTEEGTNTIEYDSRIYDSPPEGYTKAPHMVVVDGSWQQVVN